MPVLTASGTDRRGVASGIAWKRALRRRLLAWYDRRARDLPWRRTRDPYCIWVSEVMLQQTQVATVTAYYERFVRALPNIGALARAEEAAVLRLWEGLGYYRRARQLHAAARVLVEQHAGRLPRRRSDLERLPGIGRYTAAAILSIAFDAREPILEANTYRLYSRLLAYRGEPRSLGGQRALWSAAGKWLPRKRVGDFNQALMELGSEICTPLTPDCDCCPVQSLCPTARDGLVHLIPPPLDSPAVRQLREIAVVVCRRGQVLLLKRGGAERWAGMWDFPRFEAPRDRRAPLDDDIAARVAQLTGLDVAPSERLTTLKYSVTRFRVTLDCHVARAAAGSRVRNGLAARWVRSSALSEYALSASARRLATLVVENGVLGPGKRLRRQ